MSLNFELLEEDNIKVSKNTYYYDYDDGSAEDMIQEIMETAQFSDLNELTIGSWGDPCGESSRIFTNCLLEIWIMRNVKCHGLFREITVKFGLQCRS